jgi:hypothetical protein
MQLRSGFAPFRIIPKEREKIYKIASYISV